MRACANGWTREKRQRVAFCEEIQGELLAAYPGQTAAEKRAKGEMLKTAFGTYSWTKVENLDSQTLEAGLGQIRSVIASGKAGHSEVNQVEQVLAQVA